VAPCGVPRFVGAAFIPTHASHPGKSVFQTALDVEEIANQSKADLKYFLGKNKIIK